MKKIMVCVIILMTSICITWGCLSGISGNNMKDPAQSPHMNSTTGQMAESMSIHGYAFLRIKNKGGILS